MVLNESPFVQKSDRVKIMLYIVRRWQINSYYLLTLRPLTKRILARSCEHGTLRILCIFFFYLLHTICIKYPLKLLKRHYTFIRQHPYRDVQKVISLLTVLLHSLTVTTELSTRSWTSAPLWLRSFRISKPFHILHTNIYVISIEQ